MTDQKDPVIWFTDKARQMVFAFMAEDEDHPYHAVRVSVESKSPLDPRCSVALLERHEIEEDDVVYELDELRVAIDRESAELLQGGKVDWVESGVRRGFKVESPHLRPIGSLPPDGPLAERVRMVLDKQINPSVATHGGAIGLVEVRRSTAYITMSGGCQGCGMAGVTLRQGVERMLKEAIPEIESVVDVTDHRAGANPFY
jgi:Fe/S biogenesis protein NfuA